MKSIAILSVAATIFLVSAAEAKDHRRHVQQQYQESAPSWRPFRSHAYRVPILSAIVEGIASVFAGGVTSDGRYLSPHTVAVASPSLAVGSLVRVTHLGNGRSIVAEVRDRGPARRLHRIVDLTTAAANKIGLTKRGGLARVRVAVLSRGRIR